MAKLTPLERLRDLLANIDLASESYATRRRKRAARLTPADVSNLRVMYSDLRRSGQSVTSWTPIKAVCENCGLTVEPWDDVSWLIRA